MPYPESGEHLADSAQDVAQRLAVPFAPSLAGRAFSAAFLSAVPIHFAREHRILGLTDANEEDVIWVATSALSSWTSLDLITRLLRRRVRPLLCEADVLQRAINEAYQTRSDLTDEVIASVDDQDLTAAISELGRREDLLDSNARAPVVRLVNAILFEAVRSLASDVHVQPTEDAVVVRIRIDGILYDSFNLPKGVQDELVSRVKVMGKMNIAEKRLPQDGRSTVQVGDRIVDLRIASLPTSFGERVVIRLLDKSARLYRLNELGMPSGTLKAFRRLISAEHGLVLVTGPTGSGKSTTLYAALQELDSVRHNILTLEDPIEYQLTGISQTQVNEKKGLTFAAGLRNILRQDPDVIMVGEIRDRETATMAIQSAQTGHLVFSTLHTNDAASAVIRLLDLGIEPYLLASTLNGVVAQRLVRRICKACCRQRAAAPEERLWLERAGRPPTPDLALGSGAGCAACRATGLRGRLGIFELLVLSDPIRQLVGARAPAMQLRHAALANGMTTLRTDGIEKIFAGETTISEVEQATLQDSDFEGTAIETPLV